MICNMHDDESKLEAGVAGDAICNGCKNESKDGNRNVYPFAKPHYVRKSKRQPEVKTRSAANEPRGSFVEIKAVLSAIFSLLPPQITSPSISELMAGVFTRLGFASKVLPCQRDRDVQ
jgi:hypothetical protein